MARFIVSHLALRPRRIIILIGTTQISIVRPRLPNLDTVWPGMFAFNTFVTCTRLLMRSSSNLASSYPRVNRPLPVLCLACVPRSKRNSFKLSCHAIRASTLLSMVNRLSELFVRLFIRLHAKNRVDNVVESFLVGSFVLEKIRLEDSLGGREF